MAVISADVDRPMYKKQLDDKNVAIIVVSSLQRDDNLQTATDACSR